MSSSMLSVRSIEELLTVVCNAIGGSIFCKLIKKYERYNHAR